MFINSPEATQASGGNIALNRVQIGDIAREKLLPILLALSVMVNILCAYTIREYGTEQRLHQYNLDWFKTNDFASLKSQVEMQGKLIPIMCKEK